MNYDSEPRFSPTVALGILLGSYLLVGHLEHQDRVLEAQAYCESKGPGWAYSDDTKGCQKRPLPECEPARRHTPSPANLNRTIPEYCNAKTSQSNQTR